MAVKDLIWNVTDYCRGKCLKCDLWKTPPRFEEEPSLELLEKNLLSDPVLDTLVTIHLTGGEPHIHPRFLEIVRLIYDYHPHLKNLNTPISGRYPQLHYEMVKKTLKYFPNYRIDISLDGMKETQERFRGEGMYEKVFETKDLLKALGVDVRFQMTLFEENYKELPWFIRMCHDCGVGYYVNLGRFSTRFGGEDGSFESTLNAKTKREIINVLEETYFNRDKAPQRFRHQMSLFYPGIYRYDIDCKAGLSSIDLSPYGDIYPCMLYLPGYKMGSIKKKTLSQILSSKEATEVLEKVKEKKCQPCNLKCFEWYKKEGPLGGYQQWYVDVLHTKPERKALLRIRDYHENTDMRRTITDKRELGQIDMSEAFTFHAFSRDQGKRGNILEIGSGIGAGTLSFVQSLRGNDKIYTLDIFAKPGQQELFNKNMKRFGGENKVVSYKGDSHQLLKDPSLFKKPIRILFIDGSHEYEDAKLDIELGLPYLMDEGIVIFHDYYNDFQPGVKKAVDEYILKNQTVSLLGKICYSFIGVKIGGKG